MWFFWICCWFSVPFCKTAPADLQIDFDYCKFCYFAYFNWFGHSVTYYCYICVRRCLLLSTCMCVSFLMRGAVFVYKYVCFNCAVRVCYCLLTFKLVQCFVLFWKHCYVVGKLYVFSIFKYCFVICSVKHDCSLLIVFLFLIYVLATLLLMFIFLLCFLLYIVNVCCYGFVKTSVYI